MLIYVKKYLPLPKLGRGMQFHCIPKNKLPLEDITNYYK